MAKKHETVEDVAEAPAPAATTLGVFEWGGVTIDRDAIPLPTLIALVDRTLVHKLGNEVASTVKRKKDEADKAGAPLSDEDVDALTLTERNRIVAAILAGTLGLRVGTSHASTVENVAFELAFEDAKAKLAPSGLWPMPNRKAGVKAEDATVNFGGNLMTRDDIAEANFAKYRDDFLAAAKAEIERRKAAKAAAAPKVTPVAEVVDAVADLL